MATPQDSLRAQERRQRATTEGTAAVQQTLAGSSRKAIRSALIIELRRRGVDDFEPPRQLIDQIRGAGRDL